MTKGYSRLINITFEPNEVGNFFSGLDIRSNAYLGNKKIYLKGIALPPIIAPVSFPEEIYIKPGSIVSIPILINKKTAELSSIYSDTIHYERSALEFIDLETKGTATFGAQTLIAKEEPSGDRTYLSFKTSDISRFASSDTACYFAL